MFRPGGTIHPCFVTEESVGSLSRQRPLDEILNGPEIKRYRSGILTGDLVPACRDCHCKAWVSIPEMENSVRKYLREYDRTTRPGVVEKCTFLITQIMRKVIDKIVGSCKKLRR
ncbi:SPASM domain-containing protein [Candidatus Marimicrobium litorale]|uniref:SPASM domain-containing protein n=1 Tax=Candidatus Marimicrobium litorale TaxID=2518991 RepID=UPI003C12C0C1